MVSMSKDRMSPWLEHLCCWAEFSVFKGNVTSVDLLLHLWVLKYRSDILVNLCFQTLLYQNLEWQLFRTRREPFQKSGKVASRSERANKYVALSDCRLATIFPWRSLRQYSRCVENVSLSNQFEQRCAWDLLLCWYSHNLRPGRAHWLSQDCFWLLAPVSWLPGVREEIDQSSAWRRSLAFPNYMQPS